MKPQILIVDQHAIYSKGLALILSEMTPLSNIHEAVSLEVASRKANGNKFDLVVVHFPRFIPEFAAKLKEFLLQKNMNVVLVGGFSWANSISVLVQSGLLGVVNQAASPDELKNAYVNVLEGNPFFCSRFGEFLLKNVLWKNNNPDQKLKFTERELEIMKLLITGISQAKIADMLNIAKSTVVSHRERIYNKLGISSQIQLVNFCYKYGLAHF